MVVVRAEEGGMCSSVCAMDRIDAVEWDGEMGYLNGVVGY